MTREVGDQPCPAPFGPSKGLASRHPARLLERVRGLRGISLLASPWPRLQMKLVFTVVPAQKSASTIAGLKPLIGPQSSPSARAAMIR